MVHFNIGKKIEINPFEGVKFIKLSSHSTGYYLLKQWLDKKAVSVSTRKISGEWVILYDIELLDFTTLLTWFAPYRGKFYFGNKSIHFLIENDIMSCW